MTDDEKKVKENEPTEATSSSSVIRPPSLEKGGPKGLEPTRYGDWEIGGKCVDF